MRMRATILLAVVAACQSASPPAPSPEEASAQVRAFFAAAAAHDCVTMQRLFASLASDTDCKSYLETWQEQHTSLVEIVGTDRDGRDPSAVIVRVRVMKEGRERESLVRAVHSAAGWTLVF
jgi:hypothetical protein